MRLNLLFLLLVTPASLVSARCCRCRPSEPCWPSEAEWDSLNRTTNGQVLPLRPVGAVCHDPTYNSEKCKATKGWNGEQSSIWTSDHPGMLILLMNSLCWIKRHESPTSITTLLTRPIAALLYTNWEMWPEQNQSCYTNITDRSIPCGQGRVPLYTVQAQTPEDIQAGVNFSRTHNIRLAIRNTGHSYQGRSTAPESLQINTHSMKNKTVHHNFKPSGYNGTGKIEPIAVTLDAGVQLIDMYEFCYKHHVMVVGGTSNGVGAAGGFVQGGGHSMFAGLMGMASDNALEFKVVVADGRHVTANAYQNSDLFWALRGGGGGTFGVVTSVTVRAIREPSSVAFSFEGGTPLGSDAYWDAVTYLNSFLPEFNEAGGSMYYYLNPNYTTSGGMQISEMHAFGSFPNFTSIAEVNKTMTPLIDKLQNITGSSFTYTPGLYKQASALYVENFSGPDQAGVPAILGSRLLTRDLLKSSDGPKEIAKALRSLKMYPNLTDPISGIVTAGPQVWANSDIDSALHPIWRKTQLHLYFVRSWQDTDSFEYQQTLQTNLTNVEVPILKKLDPAPQGGAYLNEADAYDPEWRDTFWGPNYPRLYKIKQKWDPEGLFIVRTGVGSEDWDEEGLCPRLRKAQLSPIALSD
ncbi:hypothetical protein N7488_012332 [Penicillium malachiteum]|nr:hypothetical protein N7488_012332 [Penicillium malachiteum]